MDENVSDNVNLANSASMDHHSIIVQMFASNFLNTTALFNVGAFTALIALVPTPFGQGVLLNDSQRLFLAIGCFVLGFAFAIATMVAVFQYSLHRFQYYRGLMRGDPHKLIDIDLVVNHELRKRGAVKLSKYAYCLLPLCGVVTIMGVCLVIAIVFGNEVVNIK